MPVEHLFSGEAPSYKTVFHHYRKWCKLGEWEKMFAALVKKYKHLLDLPLSHIDGSHTPAVRGGESVDCQGRKKRKTTNALYFSDGQGVPLTMSEPQKDNHTDLYEIETRIDEMAVQLKNAGLNPDGLFTNADAGFDTKSSGRFWANMESSPTYAQTLVTENLRKITSLTRKCIRNDGQSSVQTPGWTLPFHPDQIKQQLRKKIKKRRKNNHSWKVLSPLERILFSS